MPETPSKGGRNLLVKTNQGKTNWVWAISSGGATAEDYNVDGVKAVKLTRTSDGSFSWSYIRYSGLLRNLIEPNTKYTLSFDVQPNVDVTFTVELKRGDDGAKLTNSVRMNKATANQWTKVSCVLTSKATLPDDLSQVVYLSDMPTANGNWLIIKNIKLEKSEDKTPWTPAPEDLGWSATTLVPTQEQRYLWKFEYIYYSDGSVEVTNVVNISIAGTDGIAGKDGVGVKSHLITYGLSASETTQPTSWSTQVPTLTKGNYLWTKTTWTYTDNTTETGYQKTYIAKDGNNGKDGIAGKDGVGIKNTAFFYASSTSGTTKPTTGWSATIPSVSPGNYLWTKTTWTYTDNTSETGYSVSKMGESQYTHFAYCNITTLCNENASFTLQAKSTVRYGRNDKWIYKTFEAGTYTASNATFGSDPYSGLVKHCELISNFSLTDSTGRNWLGMYSDNLSDAVANPSYFTWQLTRGATGATGPQGPQGIQGIQGPKGAQGIQGPKGADGRTQYTHIAYADNASGGGFSQTDQTKAYIGMYVDFTATDSTDASKYKWSKWHGDKGATGAQGIQGPKGADGRTPYLHIAYANSADGKTGFTTTNSNNKRYIGTLTDYTQADSTDPTKYKWVDMVGSVEVGGVNLLHNSKGPFQPKGSKIDNYVTYSNAWISMEKGKEYTLSAKGTAPFTGSHTTDKEKNEICLWLVKHDENINVDRIISSSTTGNNGTKFTWNDPSGKYYLRVNTYKIDNSNYAEDVQIEEGNVKTTYTRNPEDVQADIDSKADQALTQQQLNALAEQNSIVKAEMEAKASIDTVNQWVTAYQNYVNANDEAKAESERNLQEASARILQLKTDVGTLRQQWDFIDTYMTVQNEGLIIGKSDGSAYAKFANDRISLFSGSSEVMYISQGVLRIENGIFTKTIQIGRFRFETHPADQDMLVLRYLGG